MSFLLFFSLTNFICFIVSIKVRNSGLEATEVAPETVPVKLFVKSVTDSIIFTREIKVERSIRFFVFTSGFFYIDDDDKQ